MQHVRDLQNAWIIFDHVKRVASWTTMVCHVYDLAYCKVLTIAVCDMQFEDIEAQRLMWTKFNETMLKHKFPKPNFKGFMDDNPQANWNMIKIVYGFGTLQLGWLIRSAFVYSIRLNHSINTPKNLLDLSCKMSTRFFTTSTRMPQPLVC
jgi:hypothetical protein